MDTKSQRTNPEYCAATTQQSITTGCNVEPLIYSKLEVERI